MLADASVHTPVNAVSPSFYARLDSCMQDAIGTVTPAATLVMVQQGQVRLHQAWGWADPTPRTQPASTAMLFDLASLTKIFTATALLALLNAHGLRFDMAVVEIVAEFGAGGPRPVGPTQDAITLEPVPVPPALVGQQVDPRTVTLAQLLSHSAGLPPWRDLHTPAGPIPPPPQQPDRFSPEARWRRALPVIYADTFAYLPGTDVQYSDMGFVLLGEVIRRLHGAGLANALMHMVLRPLGMETALFNPVRQGIPLSQIHATEDDRRWRGRRVWGEVHDENANGLGGISSHAGLFCAGLDAARLGQAWLDHAAVLGIPQAWMNAATQEIATSAGIRRGLGWHIKAAHDSSAGDRMSLQAYGHTGFTGGALWIDPTRQLVAVLLTNKVYYGRDFTALHRLRRQLFDLLVQAADSDRL